MSVKDIAQTPAVPDQLAFEQFGQHGRVFDHLKASVRVHLVALHKDAIEDHRCRLFWRLKANAAKRLDQLCFLLSITSGSGGSWFHFSLDVIETKRLLMR